MIASCSLLLNSSTRGEQASAAAAACDTEVVGALRPSGDDPHFNFLYCG